MGDKDAHGPATVSTSPLRKTAPYGPPVHRLGDCAGRSPGLRVAALIRPSRDRSQWPWRIKLAAYSCGGSHGLPPVETSRQSAFPLSSPVQPGEPARQKLLPAGCPGVKRRLAFRDISRGKPTERRTNGNAGQDLSPDRRRRHPRCTTDAPLPEGNAYARC